MTVLELVPIAQAAFATETTLEGSVISIRFAGNADMRAISELEAFLPRLHAEAQKVGCTEVVVNFHSLEFMNSSCFKSFVGWISSIQELAGDKQYRIRFLSNAKLHWQRRSLHALRCFAIDLVSIEG
jgi:hypothetical protein